MKSFFVCNLLFLSLLAACSKNSMNSGGGTTPNNQHISVLTQHNDNSRAGLNSHETALTTTSVNGAHFGKLFSVSVDDQIYAQPLVVGNLSIGSGNHNTVFIATVNNSVYAIDGDNGNLYWQKNYTQSGMRPPRNTDMNSGWCSPYTDFTGNIGIVGTPVIDSVAQTLYFVARSTDGQQFVQQLHAIDISSGAERSGSPVNLSASMPGTGDGSVGGTVSFDPLRNNQRQGLLLVNGTIYISFSSHCDWNPYHGWILGYDAKTLHQKIIYNDSPDGEGGGIWQSGMGIAADDAGNLYITTGNGTAGDGGDYSGGENGSSDTGPNPNPTNLRNRGESALKLTPSGSTLQVSSYFTPSNYYNLNMNDQDYGVMGTMLIPNSNFYFTGCKDGNLYLLDKDNMGGYTSGNNNIQQTISINVATHCQPAYYKGSNSEYVYVWAEYDKLRALPFIRGSNSFSSAQITSSENGPAGGIGATLSVSSNGTTNGTGILWAYFAASGDASHGDSPGGLLAFDANDITKTIWSSRTTNNDYPGNVSKFCPPTIANGHVYLGTLSNQLVVYGLK